MEIRESVYGLLESAERAVFKEMGERRGWWKLKERNGVGLRTKTSCQAHLSQLGGTGDPLPSILQSVKLFTVHYLHNPMPLPYLNGRYIEISGAGGGIFI